MTERFEVQRTIPADATTIFAVLCDPKGHVAIDASGMLQSFTGEPAGAVGDTFVIHMDREALGDFPMGKYDVTVTITGYEQDRFITWEVSGRGVPEHRPLLRLPARAGRRRRHAGDLDLRLVADRRAVEGERDVADHPRVGAEGDPRHPRAHGAERRSVMTSTTNEPDRRVTVNGVEIAVDDRGPRDDASSGLPLVLVHGFTGGGSTSRTSSTSSPPTGGSWPGTTAAMPTPPTPATRPRTPSTSWPTTWAACSTSSGSRPSTCWGTRWAGSWRSATRSPIRRRSSR